MGWTADQEKAIYTDTGSGNILVSAAAGSGKTAVLIERVVQKILSGKSSIDRLLMVTFTEAAAAEMRERIIRSLSKHLHESNCDDTKKLLKTQIRLAQTADIMTIDAFCNNVVRNNFHALGIDPQIRICDNGIVNLLVDETIDKLFSRIYKTNDEQEMARFNRLTDFYAKDRDNKQLSDIIISIYRFVEAFPEPVKWLDDAASSYDSPVMEIAAVRYHDFFTRRGAHQCVFELEKLLAEPDLPELVGAYADIVHKTALSICDCKHWDDIYDIYTEQFGTPQKRKKFLAPVYALDESPQKQRLLFSALSLCDMFEKQRDGDTMALAITKSTKELTELYNTDMLKTQTEDLVWIVKEFIKEYSAIKEKRNLCEFSDIEHFTYTLFRDNPDIRKVYADKYDEILIDEYQDTNMLQDSIFEIISHNNIFMVGDLKQSIYRFRKGDPYIFKSKSQDYKNADSPHTLITLSQNFRSRIEVLDSVNGLFSKIMSEPAGDVNYTGGELIVRDNEYEYYPKAGSDCKAELCYLSVRRGYDLDRDLCEARFCAMRIKELLDSDAMVFDKTTSKMRPIQKRDIVILENSVKYNSKILTDELSRLGIDSYVDKSSFFDRREINIMLSLISLINNMHQDIELISVMRSPIGGFTDNDLASIRCGLKHSDYFVTAVKDYIKNGESKALAARCRAFINNIERWRGYVRKMSVAQLIWTIYEETYFYDIMGAIEEGDEAQNNLKLLYERAKQYESAGFKGLFNFIKYIEQIEENDDNISGAKLMGENSDVVRIMTIHKSKGLEFPYVFLLGAGRDFPPGITNSVVQMHKLLGMGLPYIHYDKHYSQGNGIHELISIVNRAEAISERMRLLYVALTRPREKLYVIVCHKTKAEATEASIIDGWKDKLTDGRLRPVDALNVKGFYGWLCPAAYSAQDLWDFNFYNIEGDFGAEPDNNNDDTPVFYDSDELKESVYKILDYEYPYKDANTVPTRTSVTQLKELALEHGTEPDSTVYEPDSRRTSGIDDIAELMFSPLHQKPAFMRDEGTKPANEIGTLYHLVMASLDLDRIKADGVDAIDGEISRLCNENIIRSGDLNYIDISKIKQFFQSELATRLLNSMSVHREKPFQINISARMYDPSLPPEYEAETVVLQGIIDCFFEEEDGFVLFDYKTDKVRDKAEIRSKYDKQLTLYKSAIEKLTNKPVKESYLYLFDINETI